jgi:phenylalanyl-tRNA synthetase alpha chain
MKLIQNKLNKIKKEALNEIKKTSNSGDLSEIKVKYLGQKGKITLIIRNLKELPVIQRPVVGRLVNGIKKEIEQELKEKFKILQSTEMENISKTEWIDITATPPSVYSCGHFHPITRVLNEMIGVFKSLGFQVVEGPDIETDWYNFESLNMPSGHPVRDTQESFYFEKDLLLRTQTSPVQVRYMEKHKPPIRIIVPGRVYRRDSDITHTPMFHQLEGLLIDDRVTLADLKGVLTTFAHAIFSSKRKVRFRPHHFPFTEPSAEMDISCGICQGKGCRSCKYSGWLEIMGAGMVHPQILKNGGINSNRYQGFAFGFGIERIVMLKYNINDIRLLLENDLRFLKQF